MNQTQREAIFDFLLLALFADKRLQERETKRLDELLVCIGWDSPQSHEEYERAASPNIRAVVGTEGGVETLLRDVSGRLGDQETRVIALGLFNQMVEVEGVAAEEYEIQTRARAIFRG